MTNRICNACAARARQPPDNLADLLTWLAPPLAVLNFFDAASEQHGMSDEAADWRAKWAAINGPDPVPAVDELAD